MHIKDNFVFGGIASNDYGVYLLDVHEERYTARDYDKSSIIGRSGDFINDYNRFKNLTLVMSCAVTKNAESSIRALSADLLALAGYQKLEHTFDSGHYRMGVFTGAIKPRLSRRGDLVVVDLEFDCKPQRFLSSGDSSLITLESDYAPTNIVAEGRMADIMSDEYVAIAGLMYPDERVIVLDCDGMYQESFGDDDYVLYAHFADDQIGKRLNYGYSDYDPTGSSYNGGMSGHARISKTEWHYSLGNQYIYFTTPLWWEIVDETTDTVMARSYGDPQKISNPTKFAATPLLHIDTGGTASSGFVAMVNQSTIKLSTPATVEGEALNDVYIDCETMNAYTYLADGTLYNLNKYVELSERTITLEGDCDVAVNSNIESLEIVPRWWTL